MQLRPYQHDALDQVHQHWASGHQGVLLVMPTGAGKTVVFCDAVRHELALGLAVLVVTPSVELVDQTRDKLLRLGVQRVGVIAAGWGAGWNPDAGAMVQVATVQTLRSRPQAMLRRPALIVFDEAHLAAAESYRKVRSWYPQARRLGVTATPWRLDGQGFDDLASAIVVGQTVSGLQVEAALVPFRTFTLPMTEYARHWRRPQSEFNQKDMADAFDQRELVGDVVQHWLRHAAGRSTIVFTSGVAHSQHLRDQFLGHGVTAEHLDGTTPTLERRALLGRLAAGRTTVVCNYGVLAAGFDCPRVSCVQVVRATASKALWVQQAGRGLRPCPDVGKTDCVILDHGGNALRHGNLDTVHEYRLDGCQRAEGAETSESGKECPTCCTVVGVATAKCPWCDHVFAAPEPDEVLVRDGELVEISAGAPALAAEPASALDNRRYWSRERRRDAAREYSLGWGR